MTGLNSILTEFLSLGRLEEGRVSLNLETVDVVKCVDEVFEGMRTLFKYEQTFEHRHTGEPWMMADRSLVKNILTNLISNAIKYSPEGAPIWVESVVNDELVRISVHDRGIGIPDAEQKHLSDRFFRASNAANTTQGTGLGLYIVQQYAKMMGGTLHFKSHVEEGSEFLVEFKKVELSN